ncbi:MAG: phosphoribosylformylglycinamidine synthase, partial [Comamonas sp.]
MTLHLTQFEGGNALSSFRAQQLLTDLVAIHPKITGVCARFVHLVATEGGASAAAPAPELQERLSALLTYGDPFEGGSEGAAFVVTPRLGTISPWASKATDIARNCGLNVFRVERITEYRVSLKSGLLGNVLGHSPELSAEQTAQIAALLHDRMTESVFATRAEAEKLFS